MSEVRVIRIVAEKYCVPGEHEEHMRELVSKGFQVSVREVVWDFSEGDDTGSPGTEVPALRAGE